MTPTSTPAHAGNSLATAKKRNAWIPGFLVLITLAMVSCSKSSSSMSGNGNPSAPNTVNIVSMRFSPATITVTAGTTVTWTNNDNMAHTVTSDNNGFDSGNIAAGGTFSNTFSSPGNFTYHCSFHPGMTGTVVVK